MKVWQQAYLFLYSMSVECLPVSCLVTFCISPQIENADDVLIMPLERFRKEQISAAKVRRYYDLTPPCWGGVSPSKCPDNPYYWVIV